jgi:hypothetical protein
MSETTSDRPGDEVPDDVADAGATGRDAGNLTVEDDPHGTTDPGDLAGSGGPQDDAVDREEHGRGGRGRRGRAGCVGRGHVRGDRRRPRWWRGAGGGCAKSPDRVGRPRVTAADAGTDGL